MDNSVRILVTVKWDSRMVKEDVNEQKVLETINEVLSSFTTQQNPNFQAVLFDDFVKELNSGLGMEENLRKP